MSTKIVDKTAKIIKYHKFFSDYSLTSENIVQTKQEYAILAYFMPQSPEFNAKSFAQRTKKYAWANTNATFLDARILFDIIKSLHQPNFDTVLNYYQHLYHLHLFNSYAKWIV